jgi:hypothetical protein
VLFAKYTYHGQVTGEQLGRACNTHGRKRNTYSILVRNPEGKRPLRRYRCRWEGNIKMDLTELGWGGMVWIYLAKDRDQWRALVNTVINLRVPSNVGTFSSK